jgi:hypothetical protein
MFTLKAPETVSTITVQRATEARSPYVVSTTSNSYEFKKGETTPAYFIPSEPESLARK